MKRQRQLNVKFLLILLVAVAVLGGATYGVHRFQVKRSARGLLYQSQQAEAKGDRVKAADYLERYLAYAPEDLDNLVKFGTLLAPDAETATPLDARRASDAFERVVLRNPDRKDVRRQALELELKVGDFVGARPNILTLLAPEGSTELDDGTLKGLVSGLDRAPQDGRLMWQLGQCYEATGKYDWAIACYDKARRATPSLIDAYVRLAAAQRRQGRAAEADAVMDAVEVKDGLIASNPKEHRAYLERARYRQAHRLPTPTTALAAVAADAEQARALAPDNADVLLLSAEVALNAAKPDLEAARAYLLKGVKLHPKTPGLYEALSRVELLDRKPAEAVAWFRKGIETLPKDDTQLLYLRWRLADTLIQTNQVEEATKLLAELRETPIFPELLGYLDARLQVAEGRWYKAINVLDRAAPELSIRGMADLSKRAYVSLGQCYERVGRPDQQYGAFKRASEIVATEDMTLDVASRLGMASALVAQGRFDDAIDEYRKLQALPGTPPEVQTILARALLLRTLKQGDPEQRRWQDVDEALRRAQEMMPESSEVTLLRADALAARNQLDQAREEIRKALVGHEGLVELWVALSAVAERQGKTDEALTILNDAETKVGPRVELRMSRARYWGGRGGAEGLKALDQIEEGAKDLPAAERDRLLAALADAYTRAGALDRSRRLVQQLADAQPKNQALQLSLFDQCLRDKDLTAAAAVLDRIKALDSVEEGTGDGLIWRYGQVRLLLQRAEDGGPTSALTEARNLLDEIRARRPGWPGGLVAQARIYELQKAPRSALESYEAAIKAGERSPAVIQRTAQLLMGQGRYAQADEMLKLIQNASLVSNDVQRMSASVAMNVGDAERALTEARRAVAGDSRDYQELVWFGQILTAAANQAEADGRKEEAKGRLSEAKQVLRRATDLSGTAPEPWVILTRFLVATNQVDEAKAVVVEAEKRLSADRDALALAQCHEVIGDAKKADELYQAALTARPADPAVLRNVAMHALRSGDKQQEARGHLEQLAKVGGGSPDAEWARNTLAVLTAAGGNHQQLLKALQILGVSGQDGDKNATVSTATRRTQARLLAQRPNRAMRREAITILEDLTSREPQADDLFLLARLYEADERWSKAREVVTDSLLKNHGDNASVLAYYVAALLRHEMKDEAKVYLARLEKAAPDQPGTLAIQARVLTATGQKDEAVRKLQEYAKGGRERLEPVAALLEELGQLKEAEAMYRSVREQFAANPASVLPLTGFLGRQGRATEAMALLDEDAWKALPPQTMSNACVVVMYNAPSADPEMFERVAARVAQAAKENPAKVEVRFDLANLRSIQGRFDEAEKIYRQVAQEAGSSGVPLNNLSWLLALQGGPKATEALDLIQRAMGIDGETPDLQDTRAMVYLALERPEDAIRDLEEAIAVNPTPEKYFHLARACRAAGQKTEAREHYRKAVELGLVANALHPLERPYFNELATP
jgi:tetratricopeptide (TPR) repeat protein